MKSGDYGQSSPGLTVSNVSVGDNAQEEIRYMGLDQEWVWTQTVGAIGVDVITQQK